MIESWEIERHETLVRKARARGGFLNAPNGTRFRVTKQEFPYDVGIWRNVVQGMGGSPLTWFWPFASTPENTAGCSFDTNDFEGMPMNHFEFPSADMMDKDPSKSWPPPDPDRMFRQSDPPLEQQSLLFQENYVNAFRARQQRDLRRRGIIQNSVQSHQYDNEYDEDFPSQRKEPPAINPIVREQSGHGKASWKDSDGDGLEDFGVDEEIEFYDEDDTPLAELRYPRQNDRD